MKRYQCAFSNELGGSVFTQQLSHKALLSFYWNTSMPYVYSVFHSWSICLFVFKFETKQCDLQWTVIVSKNKGSQIRFQRHQSFQKWPIGECSMNFKCQMSNILETLKLWNVLFKNDFFLENSGLNKILDSVTIQFKSHVKKFRVKKTHK